MAIIQTGNVVRDSFTALRKVMQSRQAVGPHTHSSLSGGPISTDQPVTVTNALLPPINTDSQMLCPNLNVQLWDGHRYYTGTVAPTPQTSTLTVGDLWFDGSNLWSWSGTAWVKPTVAATPLNVDVNDSSVGSQSTLNLIQGSNTTITGVNNLGASRVDVTIASTGGATAHNLLDGNIDQDTVAGSSAAGKYIRGNSGSPSKWAVSTSTIPDTFAANDLLTATSANVIGSLAIGTQGQVIVCDATPKPTWGNSWIQLGTSTLGSPAASISLTSLAAYNNLMIVGFVTGCSSADQPVLRFNNDSGANYADTLIYTTAGATVLATKHTSASFVYTTVGGGTTFRGYFVGFISNYASTEKVGGATSADDATGTTAATPNEIGFWSWKWANTSNQITRVDMLGGSGNNLLAGSWLAVYGA